MRGEAPQQLVDLLARLKLATPTQVRAAAPHVRRLAGELPDFECVWVDALRQARRLTPLQAAEINAGRGQSLLCGPYVISRRLPSPHYAECFAAAHIDTGRTVRLYRVSHPQRDAGSTARQIAQLAEQLAPLAGPTACVAIDSGIVGDGVWAACHAVDGTAAADWMVENGRFPPAAVLHIARAMLTRLADLELLGVAHGDVGAAGLLLGASGQVVLPMPGLRGIVRPAEGYSFSDLPAEAYDYLAPERVADGGPPTIASDLYACACVWWHLLTGRAPLAGGNSLARLKAAHAARIVDVRQLAADVPDALARAMDACLAREPAARPASFAETLGLLGSSARGGQAALSRCLAGETRIWQTTRRSRAAHKSRPKRMLAAATVAGVLCLAAIGPWLAWRAADRRPHTAAVADAKPAKAPRDTSARKHNDVHRDRNVTPAVALEPLPSDVPEDLVLESDKGKALQLDTLMLKEGQRVRGRPGSRPQVSVPRGGLTIACDGVCFEGIDFVCDLPAGIDTPNRNPAILLVEAQSIELRGCSFSGHGGTAPVAIAWVGAEGAGESRGDVTIADCVFQGTAAVVDCQADGGLAVELVNSLCVAAGPILRLHACPRAEQSYAVALKHTTTRGDSAVLECRYRRLESPFGQIRIAVDDSALVTNPGGGLLVFAGPTRPDELLRAISWGGQGSLVTPETNVAIWRSRPNREQPLAEDELDVDGLVRSEVVFEGSADGPLAASRITDWQAPLQSAEPPGANVNSLFLPAKPRE